jgi:hypothetical protein
MGARPSKAAAAAGGGDGGDAAAKAAPAPPSPAPSAPRGCCGGRAGKGANPKQPRGGKRRGGGGGKGAPSDVDAADIEAGPAVGPVLQAAADDRPPLSVPRRPNPFSRFFFLFIDPVVRYGHRHTLELENVWMPPAVDTKPLYAQFDAAWRKQLLRPEPDIKRAVVANCTGALVYTALLYMVSMAAQLVGPMMLQRIVAGLGCWARQGGAKGGACPSDEQLY